MLDAPTISVVMPVYNAERYLAEALDSILVQTFSDFEFIILDDGSTDTSLEILRRSAARDSRIRLISRPNTGIVGALNDALQASRGEYVARMDADDVSLPDRFERQISYLRKHADCVGVGSAILLIDADGDPICRQQWSMSHEQIEAELLQGRGGLAHPTAMLRRADVLQVGGYRPHVQYAEDVDLWLRLGESGRLANIPDVLLNYRVHPGSLCTTRHVQQALACERAVREAYERRGLVFPRRLSQRIVQRPMTRLDPYCSWIGNAILAANFTTARKHAKQLRRQRPCSVVSWALTAAAMLGPFSHGPVRLSAWWHRLRAHGNLGGLESK